MAKLKQCKVVVDIKNGRTIYCGIPLDVTGQCLNMVAHTDV